MSLIIHLSLAQLSLIDLLTWFLTLYDTLLSINEGISIAKNGRPAYDPRVLCFFNFLYDTYLNMIYRKERNPLKEFLGSWLGVTKGHTGDSQEQMFLYSLALGERDLCIQGYLCPMF